MKNYVETNVKRRTRYIDILIRFLWVAITIWGAFFAFFMAGMIMFFWIGIQATLMYFFWNHYKLEYEYIFCDGQIDFDTVRNNMKRKHILRIQLEDAEIFAPAESERIRNYRGVDTVLNYTSLMSDARIYALIVKKQDKMLKILFEPNDKMLRGIKNKIPRKVELREKDLEKILELDD